MKIKITNIFFVIIGWGVIAIGISKVVNEYFLGKLFSICSKVLSVEVFEDCIRSLTVWQQIKFFMLADSFIYIFAIPIIILLIIGTKKSKKKNDTTTNT